ncbi:MAG: NADH-quinone oxidoreductase subunit J [Phycisphaerales bacterium]|jgi:NADH-quinone oxidoreductase subunit J|nr:NADH-quinone oxidoreductase subunit J [Phycisphaerales bacterium]
MDPVLPYLACLVLALTIYAAIRPASLTFRIAAIVAVVAAAGWVLGIVAGFFSSLAGDATSPFFILFSLALIAAAIRMVSHERPIYCALHFVLVVIASAGLLLLLEAEFMAFALIIVYAGAILITYMFVLMLANQAADPLQPETMALHDKIPREPATAVGVGFLVLCIVTGTVLHGTEQLPERPQSTTSWHTLEKLPKQFEETVLAFDDSFAWPPHVHQDGKAIQFDNETVYIVSANGTRLELEESMLPTNTQLVGWSLVNDFPVSLELAGVILLMAMLGAAILARRAIELGEREKRAALLHDEVPS